MQTWDASMCCDRWNMKGDGGGRLWDERPPFSWLFTPGREENRCPTPALEKASGLAGNCPGWNNNGAPSLRNCWLAALEKSKVWRWAAPRDEEPCDTISLKRFLAESISTEHMSSVVRKLVLSFVASWLSLPLLRADLLHGVSSLLWLKANACSVLASAASSSWRSISESLPMLFSSAGKNDIKFIKCSQKQDEHMSALLVLFIFRVDSWEREDLVQTSWGMN